MKELLILAGAILAGIVWFVAHNRRADQMVRQWAASRGYTIVRRNRTWTRVPPVSQVTLSTERRTLRYVTVRDKSGAELKVWLLLGGRYFGAMVDDNVDEVWE